MTEPTRRGLIARTWSVFTGATARFSVATLLIAGAIIGIAFWGHVVLATTTKGLN